MPPKGRIEVNDNFCKSCRICVEACPQYVIGIAVERINSRGYHPAELIAEGCTACGICGVVCPEAAITVFREIMKPQQNPHEEV